MTTETSGKSYTMTENDEFLRNYGDKLNSDKAGYARG